MNETPNTLMQQIEHHLKQAALFLGLLQGYAESFATAPTQNGKADINNGYALTTPTENQMLIEIQVDGVSVNTKPRPDGRFQGYATDDDGHKQYFYGKTREEVIVKIRNHLQGGKQKRKTVKKKKAPLFGEYVQKWIEIYKKPNLKLTSYQNLIYAIEPAQAEFGNTPIDKISDSDIQILLQSITSSRKRDLCKLHLNAIFKKAVATNVIKRNPCDAVEIKRHKAKKIKALTLGEQTKFLKAAETSKHSLLFNFLVTTGLRVGEALALLRSDIDFDKCTVTVSKNVVFVKGKRIEQDTPKTDAGNRTVPVPQDICRQLFSIPTERLFPGTYNSVKSAIDRIAATVGLENVTLHVLRHTYATRLGEAGIPDKIIQYLMGHASLEMTKNVYTDVLTPYLESVSVKIRDIFKPFDT